MSKKDLRMKEITELIQHRGKVSVKDLAQLLMSSEMTVRRYLAELEDRQLIKRVHGGAVPVTSINYNEKNKYFMGKEITKNVNLKSAIGFAAASLISENETIGFDIGTTVPFIAKYIQKDMHLSAVCVTFESAFELYHKPNINLILTGGYLDRDSDVFHSDEGISFLSKVRTDKVFISAAGIDKNLGITCYHDFHVAIKKLLMKSSKQKILVADSSKFGLVSPSYFGNLSDIDVLITDENISPEYIRICEDLGINVIIAQQT
jgi:DeoR family deoxyribose operon repressor